MWFIYVVHHQSWINPQVAIYFEKKTQVVEEVFDPTLCAHSTGETLRCNWGEQNLVKPTILFLQWRKCWLLQLKKCLTQPMLFQSSVFRWNPLYRGLHHKELLLALFTCILGHTWVQHALFWDLSTLMSSGSEFQIAHVVFFPCPTKADTVAIVT